MIIQIQAQINRSNTEGMLIERSKKQNTRAIVVPFFLLLFVFPSSLQALP